MSNVHILPDENLGGVLREYVEVDRKAQKGDFIVVYGDGYIYEDITTDKPYLVHDASIEYIKFYDDVGDERMWNTSRKDFAIIEPTDIVHINGTRYRLVNRKAKEGETVIVFGHSNENGNGVFKVDDVYKVNDAISYVGKDMRNYAASSEDYRVLEPLAEKDEAPKSVLDLLALPDEKLNGILREYIEVERKANAGEKIIGKNTGNIYTVLNVFSSLIETDTRQRIHHQDYFVLEPTDIVRIDGKRYRMVDREAKVGEKVIVVKAYINGESYKNGDIFIVHEVQHSVIFVTVDSGRYVALSHFEYNVLDPVESAEENDDVLTVDEAEASKSVIDLLANLAQRVTKLERENKELRHQSHNHRLDIEQIYIDVKSLRENVDVLDERTQPLLALIKAVKEESK